MFTFAGIRTSHGEYQNIISVLNNKENKFANDQDVLHQYFPNWSQNEGLNLGHLYNVFVEHLGDAHKSLGYTIISDINEIAAQKSPDTIKVIHYVAKKPWTLIGEQVASLPAAYSLWLQAYEQIRQKSLTG